MSTTTTAHYTVFPWFLIFLIMKLGGTALANWSWLWIFLPAVPVIVVGCQKLGLI